MKRRYFIKALALLVISLTTYSLISFQDQYISDEELIGKGNPVLYGETYKLKKEANLAFLKMQKAALQDGIKIEIVSSYRDFEHQKRIWDNKYKRYTSSGMTPFKAINKIIEYSTIPGTSRHHWGTDIDIIDANKPQPKKVLQVQHYKKDGAFFQLKNWMDKNAQFFGFYLVYTESISRKGFRYEPWHYSYKPLSKNYLNTYRNSNIFQNLKNEKIQGNSFFTEDFMNSYLKKNILDINPELL